jgi:hypothetical protein
LLNIIFKIIERAINDAVLEVVRPVEFVKWLTVKAQIEEYFITSSWYGVVWFRMTASTVVWVLAGPDLTVVILKSFIFFVVDNEEPG